MATGTAILSEVRLEANGPAGYLVCPPNLRPQPGQYLIASSPQMGSALPVTIFPAGLGSDWVYIPAPLPAGWSAGMTLRLRGPMGHGFQLPASARRVALAGLDGSPARLLPLAAQALSQRAALAVYAPSNQPLAELPPEVEVLPLDLLPEATTWADFLALSISLHSIATLRERLGLAPFARLGCPAQVLVLSSMPCGGLGGCGVCSVLTRKGWALACSDGPVFDFTQLEGV